MENPWSSGSWLLVDGLGLMVGFMEFWVVGPVGGT